MKSSDVVKPFSLETYRLRRERLAKTLSQKHSSFLCLFWSGAELVRNFDSHFPFRAHSNFLYLSGFSEPESMIILEHKSGKTKSIIALRPRDLSPNRGSEVWEGERVGVERAPQFLGFDEAVSIDEIDEFLKAKMAQHSCVFWEFGEFKTWDSKLIEFSRSVRNYRTNEAIHDWSDPSFALHEMRKIKSSEEVAVMRKSAEIASRAHIRAMQLIRPRMYEFEIAAETERVFKKEGALGPAYNSICATGENACTLHYVSNQAQVQQGDIFLMDAGCEYHGYASDITRSFPATGKFSQAQREIYSVVLEAQLAAINAVRPGVPWNKPHEAAVKKIAEGLRRLKILKAPMKKVMKERLWSKYMPHGTSHWLGLDVHDSGKYFESDKKPVKLRAGNVLTIEPGLYFRGDDRSVPKKYRGIGIRIEDDVLVTRQGHEVLTQYCPKEIEDIEALRAPRL